jgi:hypothetical protein
VPPASGQIPATPGDNAGEADMAENAEEEGRCPSEWKWA